MAITLSSIEKSVPEEQTVKVLTQKKRAYALLLRLALHRKKNINGGYVAVKPGTDLPNYHAVHRNIMAMFDGMDKIPDIYDLFDVQHGVGYRLRIRPDQIEIDSSSYGNCEKKLKRFLGKVFREVEEKHGSVKASN